VICQWSHNDRLASVKLHAQTKSPITGLPEAGMTAKIAKVKIISDLFMDIKRRIMPVLPLSESFLSESFLSESFLSESFLSK
jgi:hypothetical protein